MTLVLHGPSFDPQLPLIAPEALAGDINEELEAFWLPLTGGVVSGPLALGVEPVNPSDVATKRYVDGKAPVGGPFLALAGGAMTGLLTLAIDPSHPLDAVTKRYVDDNFAPGGGGGGSSNFVLKTGDVMTGPLTITSATDAKLYVTGTGADWPGVIWTMGGPGIAAFFESRRMVAGVSRTRWSVEFGGTQLESGNNVGTDFLINRFNDAGNVVFPSPLAIKRGTGAITIATTLLLGGNPTQALEAVPKQWVEANFAPIGSTGGGGGGAGFAEAPIDGRTYGRQSAAWNQVIASNNDTVDGGNF